MKKPPLSVSVDLVLTGLLFAALALIVDSDSAKALCGILAFVFVGKVILDISSVEENKEKSRAARELQLRKDWIEEFDFYREGDIYSSGDPIRQGVRIPLKHLVEEKKIFGLVSKKGFVAPSFQFDGEENPKIIINQILQALPVEEMSEWEIAFWWTAGNSYLAGQRPIDLLETEPSQVVAAAELLEEAIPT